MSRAIDTLMAEHRQIERSLSALDDFASTLGGGGDVSRETLRGLVDFIREFADIKHHGKEEDMLFVAMVEAGLPREVGPIAVMLQEHDMGRAHVRALAAVAAAEGPWAAAERELVVREATGFTSLLRDHIAKEDNVLYPMAMARLSAEALAELDRRVDEFEQSWSGPTGFGQHS